MKKRLFYTFTLIPIILILCLFVWFFSVIFEGEKPRVALEPMPEYLSGVQKFALNIEDLKRGLKWLKVSVNQEGRELTVLDQRFPFKGLLNREGAHHFREEVVIDPLSLNLAQGRVDLNVNVWDYAKRNGGNGNMTLLQHRMIVDTIPPSLKTTSRMNNINLGGACLLVYQASSDAEQTGVFVNELFFPGFAVGEKASKGSYVCFFALPFDSGENTPIYLWAKDQAANTSTASFYHHIRRKGFRKDTINITDGFLRRLLPYFSFYSFAPGDTEIQKFLKINNGLRNESHERLIRVTQQTSPEKLWDGPWLRLPNAATMARFADHRIYYYRGEKIDEKDHLGMDLASLANSPVPAANHGRVLFAERNGIYGLTVVIDHGLGVSSVYGHLSKIEVKEGQEVRKGDKIGYTGHTGLAGGDHLHFGMMVWGVPVNPIEWWDGHWIQDNIARKLALLDKAT
jgi:hypothetical protein